MSASEGRLTLVGGTAGEGLAARVAQAITRASQYLFATQHARGYWHAPLEANATMEAEYVFCNRLLGRERPDVERRLAERLLALQQADGSWPIYHNGPGGPSTTIEAYFALKLTGMSATEPALVRARDFILGRGGLARAGVFTRIWLAYFGQFPWAGVPSMPVELVLLPPWFPLNIYAMSSWARGTVVPLTLLLAHRPSVRLPAEAAVAELWLRAPTRDDLAFARSPELVTTRNFFLAVDRALKTLAPLSWRGLRRRAVARAIEWLLRHQDTNGQWGGIQPAMVNSVLALHAVGFAADHPAMMSGIQGVEDFLVECEGTLMYQPCVSPNWDTALAARALLDAGLDPAHPALGRAAEWLVANQIFRPGDWAVIDPPTEDVTGRVLHLMGTIGYRLDFGRARRAVEFLRRTQRSDGSWWGRWGVNFIYGTWGALAGLERIGEDMRAPYVRRAVEWLATHQNPDGGWGETVASYDDESLAGKGESTPSQTAWALLGLLAADGPSSPAVERGVDWLVRTQGPDGTWQERLFTGTGFPRHFYLRYHLYRHYFPLMALGQYRARLPARGEG